MLQDPNVERYVSKRLEPLQKEIKELQAISFKLMQANKLPIPVVVNHVCPDPMHHAMEIGLVDKCPTCGAE